jgi:hypothetical protein
VHRAPGIPHALWVQGRQIFCNNPGASRGGAANACLKWFRLF